MNHEIYTLCTSFGDFDIHIDSKAENKEEAALNVLKNEILNAKCRQAYYDNDNHIYAVDIGFYYGSKVVEIHSMLNNEDYATQIAAEQLIEEL